MDDDTGFFFLDGLTINCQEKLENERKALLDFFL